MISFRFSITGSISHLVAIICLTLLPVQIFAAGWQHHDALHLAAKQLIHDYYDSETHELDVKYGYIDRRLRLARCQQALQAFLPTTKPPLGATSIGIRCESPAWKVHLPVQVRVYTQVVVTTQPIARNSIIQASDLQLQKREISRYRGGIYSVKDQLLGMVAKRPLRQDVVLTPRLVKPRRLVSRGQPVTIIADFDGLRIRTQGEALSNGHRGQIIRVENSRSGKKIAGEVIAPSTVKVKM